MDSAMVLSRESLGRLAKIGDLYDACSDSLTGLSLFPAQSDGSSDEIPLIVANKELRATSHIVMDGAISEKFTQLDIEDELQLSLVAGLTRAEGQTASLIGGLDGGVEGPSVSGCLVYKVTTFDEDLDVGRIEQIARFGSLKISENEKDDDGDEEEDEEEEEEEILVESSETPAPETSEDADNNAVVKATHIVVGISWGGFVALNLRRALLPNGDKKTLQADMENLLQTVALADASGIPDDVIGSYSATVFTDVLPSEDNAVEQSVEGACNLIRALPTLLGNQNGGKGMPLTYTLLPLSAFSTAQRCTTSNGNRFVEVSFSEIERDTNRNVVRFLDELSSVKRQVDHLEQIVQAHEDCLMPDEVSDVSSFRSELDAVVESFRLELAGVVVDVRCGRKGIEQLDRMLNEFRSGAYSIDTVTNFLFNYDHMVEKAAFVDALRKEEVLYIANDSVDMNDITRDSDVYVLFANDAIKKTDRELWNENCLVFFALISKQRDRERRANGSTDNAVTFVYVDGDFAPSLGLPAGVAIYHYQYGKCVCKDAVEDQAIVSSMSIVESLHRKEPVVVRPRKRVLVELRCPGSLSRCDDSQRQWSCEKCREHMEYGFDDFFYCVCGRAPCHSFSFRCSGTAHGDDFMEFPTAVMKEHLGKLQPIRELNILFLGETGVGKSTWINGFANYLSFSTLEEAEASESVCLIPSKFTMTNEDYEEVEITTGMDKNEDHQTGRSATQMPKSYVFRRGKLSVRIIDTPGIGDTRGIDQDKVNFQNIMTHLSNIDEINGICVLLKPNNARLTVMFSFCIKELLTHLHRDACKNIVFCFTNARGTFYRPGDTLPALRKLLTENQEINIKLCKETIYCVDNEAVRFLAALKHGIKFSDAEKKNYANSWETSVAETERLIDHISSLHPHKVKNTLSLNDARRLIVALSRPLAEITSTIQNNISVVEDRQKEVKESTKHKDDLSQGLYIPAIDLETAPLNHPRTVCTSPGCVKHVKVGGVEKIDYVQHCHPHCGITGAPTNTVNCVALQHCDAMGGRLSCQRCGCSWSVHMHITYECRQVLTQVVDTNVEKQIRDKATNIEIIQGHLRTLEERMVELEDEKKQIAEVSAKFGCFLKNNAIAPYNDAMADYLDHLIKAERGKVSAGGDRKVLDGLENMRSMYLEEIQILDSAIKSPGSCVRLPTPDDVKSFVGSLYKLPISGPMLEKAMQVAESSAARSVQYSERRVQPYRKCYHTSRPHFVKRAWQSIANVFPFLSPSYRKYW